MPEKKQILLIRPANIYGYNNYPSLGLLSIATSLHHAGYDTQIVNCALEREARAVILAALHKTFLVGLTMMTSECPDAYSLLSWLRKVTKLPIVVGGWHATLFPTQILHSRLVDYVITGEGEIAIQKLLKWRLDDDFRRGIVDSGAKIKLQNQNRVLYQLDQRIEQFITRPLTDTFCQAHTKLPRWLPYESSRGCPGECTFCANVVTGNRQFRAKPPDQVVYEMLSLVKFFGLNHIKIVDDNFFVDINRVRLIVINCRFQDRSSIIPFTWDAECRCDYFNEKMLNDLTLELCKLSGLVQITLGIESGDQKSLDKMKKGITPEQAEYAVAKCDEHGIFARCSFIVGLPGESRSAIERTNRFINKLRRKYRYFSCGVQTFRPYPKCELTADLIESGRWSEPAVFLDWAKTDNVKMFTDAQLARPWQLAPAYTNAVATYQSIESGISLPAHMLKSRRDKVRLRIFQKLAHWRNRRNFYRFPIDKRLYSRFHRRFFNG